MRKKAHLEIKSERSSFSELSDKQRKPIYIIADNIRSMHNVGSIFRSSDAVCVKKLYLCGITPYPPRKEITKTALDAERSVPWEYHEDVLDVIKYLKSENIPLIALEHITSSHDFQEFNYPFPLALIVGNETDGISEYILPYIDHAVEIPMSGIKQSLNVSVATGIILYELHRQFKAFP